MTNSSLLPKQITSKSSEFSVGRSRRAMIFAIVCIATFACTVSSRAQILFTDTFTAANGEMNAYSGGGQSGTLSTPISYTMSGASWQTQILNNSAIIYASANTASFSLAHSFTNSQQLTINAAFDRPQGTGWLKFGAAPNTDFNVAGGASFVVDGLNNVYLYNNGIVATSLGSVLQATGNTLQIALNSSANYDDSGTVGIDAWLNGVQLDLNGAGAGNTYTRSGGFSQNHVTFAQFSGGFNSWTIQDWQVEKSVFVPTGDTLLLSQSGQVSDSAVVTLSGGTIQRGAGVSEDFGNLTLTSGSFLDYGLGATGTLRFGVYSPDKLLTVQNFGEGNALRFGNDVGSFLPTGGALTNSFFSFNNAFVYDSNTFTITAIPEPSTCLVAVGLLGLMLWPARRLFVRGSSPQSSTAAPVAH